MAYSFKKAIRRFNSACGFHHNRRQVVPTLLNCGIELIQLIVLKDGRILLRYKRYPEGVHQRASEHTVLAEAGYGGPRNVTIYLTESNDDGLTWSEPRDVSRQMKRKAALAVGAFAFCSSRLR